MLPILMKAGDKMQKEKRQYLSRTDVKQYLQKYPDITAKEKRDLVKWLKSGQSPKTNDCNLYNERGYPLDFIDARRTEQDLFQIHMMHLSEPEECVADSTDDSSELPF